MQDSARYAYVTLAIVGVVALLAMWFVVGPAGISLPSSNTAGHAFAGAPVTQSVKEGEATVITTDGLDYEVRAIAVPRIPTLLFP